MSLDLAPAAVRAAVVALVPGAIAMRRDLHQHAELSTKEHRTQGVIIDRLRAIGAEDVHAIADTGVTALVRGALAGPNLLWRADIDALPLQEATGLEFASEDAGAMHACAHDGHTAIALAFAELLHGARASLRGTVRLAFQPAEEHVGGAQRMIDAGVMDQPKIDRVFGLHIWADDPAGEVLVVPGAIFAASTHFRIIVEGKGGHASAPHGTIDPILVAAHAVVALQSVVSRSIDPADTAVLTVGRIEGGVRGNIIPEQVMMSGTMRAFDDGVMRRMIDRAAEILAGTCAAWGATCRFDHSTLPACVNDTECSAIVARAATGVVGADHVGERRITGADDMALFLERAPGAYFLLGAGHADRARRFPHHHPRFDFDEDALAIGIELALRVVEEATGSDLR